MIRLLSAYPKATIDRVNPQTPHHHSTDEPSLCELKHPGLKGASFVYVHTLLFLCPECNQPAAASLVREDENSEGIDSRPISLDCHVCGGLSDMSAIDAKQRWVLRVEDPTSLGLLKNTLTVPS
jgi:hypothetical protein